MILKPLTEPLELKLMRQLNSRMTLSEKERAKYWNLEKGYEGEVRFEKLLQCLSNDQLLINDLLLECSNSHFQNDSILILPETIYLFEVKNFEGDYIIENDKWYSFFGTEIKNPILQLTRNESLLRRLIQDLGFNLSLQAYVVFVHPEFHLFQASKTLPIIYPTQLNRLIKKLNSRKGYLKTKHHKFAEILLSRHISKSPYSLLPEYNFNSLKKGITCSACYSMINNFTDRYAICSNCGRIEHIKLAVTRNVEELKLLFPEYKVTTNTIYEWCGRVKGIEAIQIILTNNYKKVGRGRSTHYL